MQKAQNLLAHVVTSSSQPSSYTPTAQLAPIEYCINFPHSPFLWAFTQPCMFIILLILWGCQIPICSLFCLLALHLVPAASALQLLKSGTLSLQLLECVPAPTLLAITSRLSNRAFEWNMRFSCFRVLPGSTEALVRWGGKYITFDCLLFQ